MADEYAGIRDVLGTDDLPDWTLEVRSEDIQFVMAKCAIAQTGHLARIASALETLASVSKQNRRDELRRRRKS